jgi:multidrug efflux pump subunit AcrA (membrane-fusion protein)
MSDTVIVRPDDSPPRRSRAAAGIIIVLILAGLAAWAWYATRPEPARVVRRDIQGQIPLAGELITPPSARADVGAPFRAPVEKVFVSVGKRVGKGDWLVQLSVPNAQAVVEQARQNMLAAETAYANAKKALEAPVDAARRNLVNAQAAESASRPAPVTTVNPNGGTTTVIPSTGGQASAARVAAEQALAQAEASRDAQIGPYKTQLDMAREAYQAAKGGENLGVIKSPITGTVLALNAVPGQEAGKDPKIPIATVVDLSAVQAQAPLDNAQAGYVKPGMDVSLTFAELPGKTFEGKVSKITSTVDEKLGGLVKESKYIALVDFKNTDGAAKPGMKPMIALKTGDAKGALAVPSEAVDVRNGVPTVKVLRGGQWQVVSVQTGVSDGRYTQVKEGLKEGETVQVTPNLVQAATR